VLQSPGLGNPGCDFSEKIETNGGEEIDLYGKVDNGLTWELN